MMKLSIESYAVRQKFGELDALKLIKECGFDCVDMSYYWTQKDAPLLADNYREYAIGVRAYLDEIGLSCNQAHAPFDIGYGESFDISNPHYRDVVRAIESASILGAGVIVVHAIPNYHDATHLFDEAYNRRYYESLIPFARKFGIRIAVENLFSYDQKRKYHTGLLGTPEALHDFILSLNSDCFVACVDVGHAAITGNEPEEFITSLGGDLLRAVHIQDGDYQADRHTLPLLGDFSWGAIMQALRQVGYDGELTFEIFHYLKNFPNELMPDALCFAEKIGRYLISLFEEA